MRTPILKAYRLGKTRFEFAGKMLETHKMWVECGKPLDTEWFKQNAYTTKATRSRWVKNPTGGSVTPAFARDCVLTIDEQIKDGVIA
jgi:hypothetical protein